ncbi:hypothetical protein F5B20DRAFT_593375 [Whalleya microplaca]|nr:hypothetical protein F5B20DRAFT_593375 [Whalleya microplaca]
MPTPREQNEELLESAGISPDVTVKCDDRTWHLHKAILPSRSRWFNVALTRPLKEALTSEITMEEKRPEAVDWVITWIYTRVLDPAHFDNEDVVYAASAELYKTADFFLLDDLQETCYWNIRDRLRQMAILIQKSYCKDREPCLIMEDSIRVAIKKGIEAAYKFGVQEFQAMWIEFVKATMWWVLTDQFFRDDLKSIPEFAAQLLPRLLYVVDKHRYAGFLKPEKCSICNQDPWKYEDRYYVRVVYSDSLASGICNICRRGPSLLDP